MTPVQCKPLITREVFVLTMGILMVPLYYTDSLVGSRVPDKRGLSGLKCDEAGQLTELNNWVTWEDVKRPTSTDPSKLLVSSLPLHSSASYRGHLAKSFISF